MRRLDKLCAVAGLVLIGAAPACDRCSGPDPSEPDDRGADGGADTAPSPSDGGAGDVTTAARNLAHNLEKAAAQRLETPCERAYAVMLILAKTSKTHRIPLPDPFMEVCRELPEEMQLCLSPGYQVDNLEDCIAVRESLDPEQLRRLQSVMTTGR